MDVSTLIYKDCIFGHSDDCNLFLIGIWSSSSVPGSGLKTLGISCHKSNKCVFFYVNEGDFWSSPKGGGAGRPLVVRATNQVIRRLETLVPSLLLHLWETERGEGQVEVANVQ